MVLGVGRGGGYWGDDQGGWCGPRLCSGSGLGFGFVVCVRGLCRVRVRGPCAVSGLCSGSVVGVRVMVRVRGRCPGYVRGPWSVSGTRLRLLLGVRGLRLVYGGCSRNVT